MTYLVDEAFPNGLPSEIDKTGLLAVWNETFPNAENAILDEATKETLVNSFLIFSGEDKTSADLHMISGGWKITLSPNLFKMAFTSSVLTAALHSAGMTSFTGYVLPAVVSLLFDIDKILLTRSEEYLLAELKLSEQAMKGIHTPERLFSFLNDDIRDQISYLDFLDFIENLKLTGNTIPRGDKNFEIAKKQRLKITLI